MEIISKSKLPPIQKNAKMKILEINNILVSLNFLKSQNIKLVGIGAEGKHTLPSGFHTVLSAYFGRCPFEISASLVPSHTVQISETGKRS
jgi:hypothetical protein